MGERVAINTPLVSRYAKSSKSKSPYAGS